MLTSLIKTCNFDTIQKGKKTLESVCHAEGREFESHCPLQNLKNLMLKETIINQLKSSQSHLDYSFKKVKDLNLDLGLDEEKLETLESFASRFARSSDIVVAKYFRFLAMEKDPAWRGSIIDLLNLAEKHHWIKSAQVWKRIRELRNLAAHEYQLDSYIDLYKELIKLAPEILAIPLDL